MLFDSDPHTLKALRDQLKLDPLVIRHGVAAAASVKVSSTTTTSNSSSNSSSSSSSGSSSSRGIDGIVPCGVGRGEAVGQVEKTYISNFR